MTAQSTKTTRRAAPKSAKSAVPAKKRAASTRQQPGSIGETASVLLGLGLSNPEVLAVIRHRFPESKTSPACISWYRSRLGAS